MNQWKQIKSEKPPEGIIVNTKISDELGERNEQKLIFKQNLWWDTKLSMHVYYTPTHWKEL